jgi:tRNA threonylcarbamoyladenosine biosynthesis protein TsaB
MPDPRILAIETSGRLGSVAVALGPTLLAARDLSPTQHHAVELMPAVRDLTLAQGWAPDQIDHVYLSLGPGSFTGLRIAVAVARALHQATGCKLIGVPSLDIIAQNAPPEFPIVIPMLDAKRDHVFAARYERDATGALRQTLPAALVEPATFLAQALQRAAELQSPVPNAESQISNLKSQIALLGEALTHFTPSPSPLIESLSADLWHARAQTLHQLGCNLAQAGQFSDPATLLPLYIRLPEAEEVYRKKHGLPT